MINLTFPPLAAVYGRLSKGDSALESHEARNLKYLELRDFKLAAKFEDEDTSGGVAILDRPGGRALFNRLRFGDVRHLVVAKLDRLGRWAADILQTIEELDRLHITLHIVDFGGDTVTTQGHMGKLILTLFAGVAEWERNEIRERTRKMAEHKFDHGELTGTVPYGFDCEYHFADGSRFTVAVAFTAAELMQRIQDHGNCLAKTMQPNPHEQIWVRRMHAWRTGTPKHSLKWIADQLNAQGVRSKAGGRWQTGNVDGVLKSKYTRRLLAASAHTGISVDKITCRFSSPI